MELTEGMIVCGNMAPITTAIIPRQKRIFDQILAANIRFQLPHALNKGADGHSIGLALLIYHDGFVGCRQDEIDSNLALQTLMSLGEYSIS